MVTLSESSSSSFQTALSHPRSRDQTSLEGQEEPIAGPSKKNTATTTVAELDELLLLTATLQLQDAKELTNGDRKKGKAREDAPPSDEQVALKLFAKYMESLLCQHADACFAKSLNEASRLDDALLREYEEVERRARADREMALRMSDNSSSSSFSPSHVPTRDSPPPEKWASTSRNIIREAPKARASTTLPHEILEENPVHQPEECVICGDEIAAGSPKCVASCPDRHVYDQRCLLRLVFATMKDETLMPPKCCQVNFDEDTFLPLLDTRDRNRFLRKREEFGTKDRLYCSNASCSAFLGAAQRDLKAPQSCKQCGNETCKACKGQWHGNDMVCTGDSDEVAIDLLKEQGMSRCPDCRRMVELAFGCNHIVSLYSFLQAKHCRRC